VFVQDLVKPSVKEEADQVVKKPLDQPLVAAVPPPSITESFPTTPAVPPTTNTDDCRVPIKFLQDGTGYTDRIENERLMRRSKQYILVNGVLMRKNTKEEVLMKCITREVGIQLLHEIRSGTCGNHAASRTLSAKPSEQVSTGRLSWPMQRSSSGAVIDVSFSPNEYTY
jgi:hypothetical protein